MSVALVENQIVLPVLHSVAVGAAPGEDLEASPDTARIPASIVGERRPVHVALMGTDLSDLVFVTLDAPKGADVVSVEPALGLLVGASLGVHEAEGSCSDSVHNRLDEHLLPYRLIPCSILFDLAGLERKIRVLINYKGVYKQW